MFPIYGEKYIERSLRSLLDQTLEDIEFILVDDRSPDSAYEKVMLLLEEGKYAHLKDNVKIIRHDVNKGVHVVRRTGWEASSGDYIYQCDSDDWLDKDMLRILWEKAVEGGYDMVECNYFETDGEGHFTKHVHDVPDKAYEDWMSPLRANNIWNKLVRRSIYQNEIIWPQHPYLEDYALVSQLYYYSDSWCYLDQDLYYYYRDPSGITISADTRKRVRGQIEQEKILERFMRSKSMYEKYWTLFTVSKADTMVNAWDLPRKEFLQVFPEDRLAVLLCKAVPLEKRLGILTKLLGIHGIRGKKRG